MHMLFSTLVPALILVAFIQLVIIRFLKWRWLSYSLPIAMGIALLSTGAVHLAFAGIEVAALGYLVTLIDPLGYWRKK
jgi:hypothetical protein